MARRYDTHSRSPDDRRSARDTVSDLAAAQAAATHQGGGPPDDPPPRGLIARIKAWTERHHGLLWWGHSIYALFLGVMVILFAAKGFEYARILAATLGATFLVMLLLFRFFGHGAAQKEKVAEKRSLKLRFFLMTYALKNLYQGMLFFLLPFYWKSSTIDSWNGWFVFVLGLLALLSTMDIIFDNLLMRYRPVAAAYYTITLFACLNLVIPAFIPKLPTIVILMSSAAFAVLGFWFLHVGVRSLRDKRSWAWIGAGVVAMVTLVYVSRIAIPPVPNYLTHAAVGPDRLEDGRLAVEVTRVHRDRLGDLWCVTEVALPGGRGDSFKHVWIHRDGDLRIERTAYPSNYVANSSLRLTSSLTKAKLPEKFVGRWAVDTMTHDGQIVGRARFEVIE